MQAAKQSDCNAECLIEKSRTDEIFIVVIYSRLLYNIKVKELVEFQGVP